MLDKFLQRNAREWERAIASLDLRSMALAEWDRAEDMLPVLQTVMQPDLCHAYLPGGGGYSFFGVRLSREQGCIEFKAAPNFWHLAKPVRLTLSIFADDPVQTFLLIELGGLAMAGEYERDRRERLLLSGKENVVRLPPGEYMTLDTWETNAQHDDDDDDDERSASNSEGAATVVRWLGGQILAVAKASIWNSSSRTYMGLHNNLSAAEIKQIIDACLQQS
jgi:hypothetical protein